MMNITRRTVHAASGAGHWYPAEGQKLSAMVDRFIDTAEGAPAGVRVLAGIAPHAGYLFSGATAGFTWRALRDAHLKGHPIDTLVILGFSHRHAFEGAIIMDGDALQTPLGEAALDPAAARELTHSSSRLQTGFGPHQGEHSAENQIPFAQRAIPHARLVVILTGDRDCHTVTALANALVLLRNHRRIAVVASTDLLHDPDYETVMRTDRRTLADIANLNLEALAAAWTPANQICCGLVPLLTALTFARACHAQSHVLHYRNSGDADPRSRGDWVVGYGSVIFYEPTT